MAGVDSIGGAGMPTPVGDGNNGERADGGRGGDPAQQLQPRFVAPGGSSPPSRSERASDQSGRGLALDGSPSSAQWRRERFPIFVRSRNSNYTTDDEAIKELERRGYSPAALTNITGSVESPDVFKALIALDYAWHGFNPTTLVRLFDVVESMGPAGSTSNENVLRAKMLSTLLECRSELVGAGYADLELLSVVDFLRYAREWRLDAMIALRDTFERLHACGYAPWSITTLLSNLGPDQDARQMLEALCEYEPLVGKLGLHHSTLAEMPRIYGIEALRSFAEHHQFLSTLGYSAVQLTKLAHLCGPDVLDFLTRHPELTRELKPDGVVRLINSSDDSRRRTLAEANQDTMARLQEAVDKLGGRRKLWRTFGSR